MRALLIFIFPVCMFAQSPQWIPNPRAFNQHPGSVPITVVPTPELEKPSEYKFPLRSALIGFTAGAAWGIHETSVNWPDRIPPSWNEHFWDNRVSWQNKYKRGDDGELLRPLTPKFFGSTSFLVATTDAKHLFASVHRWGMLGAGVSIGIGEKRKWWHYAADIGITALAYGAGFQVSTFAFKL